MMLITMMLTITKRRAKVQSTDIQNVENKIVLERSCNRFVGRQNPALDCTTMMGSEDCHALSLWRQSWIQGFHALFCLCVPLETNLDTRIPCPPFFCLCVPLETNLDTRIPCLFLSLCSFGDQYGHMDFMSFSPFLWRNFGHKDSMPLPVSLFLWRPIWTQGFDVFLFLLRQIWTQKDSMSPCSFYRQI